MRPLHLLMALVLPCVTFAQHSVQQQVEQWHKTVSDKKKPLACAKEARYEHKEENVVFDMVDCGVEGATKEFLFDKDKTGSFDKDGR